MPEPLLSVIVATAAGREASSERTREGFARETPADVSIEYLTVAAASEQKAWDAGIMIARGEYVMFASDEIEPHPGWCEDALAAARAGFIVAPALWLETGECILPEGAFGCDWSVADTSRYPFLARSSYTERHKLTIMLRTGYAFTWWRE